MSMSSENLGIRPKALDSEVPPLKRMRGLSDSSPLKSASSVQHTQKFFSTFWMAVPRRAAAAANRPARPASLAAMIWE